MSEAGLNSTLLDSVARQVVPTFVALQFNVAVATTPNQPTKSSCSGHLSSACR